MSSVELHTEKFIKAVEDSFKDVPSDYTLYAGYTFDEEHNVKPQADLPEHWHFENLRTSAAAVSVVEYFLRKGYHLSKLSYQHGHGSSVFIYAKKSTDDVIKDASRNSGGCFSVVLFFVVCSGLLMIGLW